MQTTYCVSCKKMTGNKNAKVFKTKNGRLQLKSICSVCGERKSQFVSKGSGFIIISRNQNTIINQNHHYTWVKWVFFKL